MDESERLDELNLTIEPILREAVYLGRLAGDLLGLDRDGALRVPECRREDGFTDLCGSFRRLEVLLAHHYARQRAAEAVR